MIPKISVIVPIYNSETTLRKCLDSIKNQTFTDFEVLMINDGSTDSSEDICNEYVNKDQRFKYYKKVNGGKASAVNLGYEKTTGKFISIIDSDDFISHKLYNITYELANIHNVDIVNYSYNYIKDGKKVKNELPFPKNRVIDKEEFKQLLKSDIQNKHQLLWFTAMNLIRKKLLDENNILHNETIKIGIDTIFNLECYLNAERIYSISEAFYYYVYNSNSITQTNFKPNLLDNLIHQFNTKREIYDKYQLREISYKNDLAKYYIEHSLFFLLNNEKHSKNKLQPKKLKNIRHSDIYQYCFKFYKTPSKNLPIKKKLTIYLFKNNRFKTLCLIHKFFGNG